MVTDKPKPKTKMELAAYIVDRVADLGIDVRPGSRLLRMRNTLQRGYIPYEDPEFPIALEAIRDMYQLQLIVDTMDDFRDDPKFLANVERLLKDSAIPQEGNDNTPGRNYQFQMYLAAICLRSNLAVTHGEPDVTCVAEGIKFAIAAKRLKKFKQLKDRIKDGIDQIERASLPGIIAIDLTMAWNTKNQPVISSIQSQVHEYIAYGKNKLFRERHEADTLRRTMGTNVMAILLFDFTFRLVDEKWKHEGRTSWLSTTHGNPKTEQELRIFQEAFKRGMPHLIDDTASDESHHE